MDPDREGVELHHIDTSAAGAPPLPAGVPNPQPAPAQPPPGAPDEGEALIPPNALPAADAGAGRAARKTRFALWGMISVMLIGYGLTDMKAQWPLFAVGLLMGLSLSVALCSDFDFLWSVGVLACVMLATLIPLGITAALKTSSAHYRDTFKAWCPTACNETVPTEMTRRLCDELADGYMEHPGETYAICALRMMGACAGGDRGKEDVLTCYRMTRDALEEERGNDSLKAYEVLVALELHSLFVLVMCLCMSLLDVSPRQWKDAWRWVDDRLGGRLRRWGCCLDAGDEGGNGGV